MFYAPEGQHLCRNSNTNYDSNPSGRYLLSCKAGFKQKYRPYQSINIDAIQLLDIFNYLHLFDVIQYSSINKCDRFLYSFVRVKFHNEACDLPR